MSDLSLGTGWTTPPPQAGADLRFTPPFAANKLRPLLDRLALEERNWLLETGHNIRFLPGKPVQRQGDPVDEILFVTDGIAILKVDGEICSSFVALVGSEGVLGTEAILGVHQASASAYAITETRAVGVSTEALLAATDTFGGLRAALLGYCHTLWRDTAALGAIHANLPLIGKLAFVLVEMARRVPDGEIAVTHQTLADILRIRRSGVTDALHILEGAHLISNRRRHVRILDKTQLLDFAARRLLREAT